MKNKRILPLFFSLITLFVIAQPALIKDINSYSASSNPQELLTIGNRTFFSDDDGVHGGSLWVSDGTTNGTRFIKNFTTDGQPAYMRNAIEVNGQLVFFVSYTNANFGATSQLWKSDGTEQGTVKVMDLGFVHFAVQPITLGSLVFFSNNGALWKTDLTPAGTKSIRDIKLGSDNGTPLGNFERANGLIFFVAIEQNGNEIWRTDGTDSGTFLVKDINAGSSGSNPRNLVAFGNRVFFTAMTNQLGVELWSSDGTTAGTTNIIDLHPGFEDGAFQPHVANGILFFYGKTTGSKYGLWRTDGTAVGTQLVNNTLNLSFSSLRNTWTTSFREKLYFNRSIYNDFRDGELWESDGTTAGTKFVHYLPSSHTLYRSSNSDKFHFGQSDSLLIFGGATSNLISNSSDLGIELWATDGTTNGSRLLKDIYRRFKFGSNPRNFAKIGNNILFSATDQTSGNELWRTDGTEGGTVLLKNINAKTASSNISNIQKLGNNQIIFRANDNQTGFEPWRSDGTFNGTYLLNDIWTGGFDGLPQIDDFNFFEFQGKAFFSANDSLRGRELWQTDGTITGTRLFKDLNPTSLVGFTNNDSNPSQFFQFGNGFLFQATDSAFGRELWRSEGTEGSTLRFADLSFGKSHTSFYSNFTNVNGKAFFIARAGRATGLLWQTDGTDAGTTVVPGSDTLVLDTYYQQIYKVKNSNKVLFYAYLQPGYESALFASDGSSVQLLKKMEIKTNFASRNYFADLGNTTLFAAVNDLSTGLWRTDGTPTGTTLVRNFPVASIFGFKSFKNELFFIVLNPLLKTFELWRTGGSDAGTLLVQTFPSPNGSVSVSLDMIVWNNRLYFAGRDTSFGGEIWSTDGTTNGTRREFDIRVGSESSNPNGFTEINGSLVFIADNGETGAELWRINPSGTLEPLRLSAQNVTVSPNPSTDVVQFDLEENVSFDALKIYDSVGKLMKNVDISTANKKVVVSVVDLPAGIYHAVFTGSNTSSVISKKIMKSK